MTAFASREHRLVVLCALADACTGLAHAGVQSDRGERLADLVLAWAEGKRPRLDEGTDEVLRELYEAILARRRGRDLWRPATARGPGRRGRPGAWPSA